MSDPTSLGSAGVARRLFRRRSKEERLVYCGKRCPCGALYAYDPGAKPRPDAWDCSDILLGHAVPSGQPGSVTHDDTMPFVFSKVKTVSTAWALAHRVERPESEKTAWQLETERINALVRETTGIEGHAIRCGWAILESAGIGGQFDEEGAKTLIGQPFYWLRWKNVGAIVAAEPHENGVKVEVWAVPA